MSPNESTTTRFDPKPTPCALIEDLLPLYVEGEVSPGARDLIAEHLATCEHCAGFLAGAQSVRAQLRHDQQARRSVVADDKPAVQAVTAAQFAIAIGAVLCIGMIGLFVFGFSDFYAAQQLLGLIIPFGAVAAAAYAVIMLLRQRRGKHRMDRWLSLSAVAALAGISMLGLLSQVELIVRIVELFIRLSPLYLVYRIAGELAPLLTLGVFGLAGAVIAGALIMLLRKNGQTSNPE